MAGVAKPAPRMNRMLKNPSYKEPQHKNLKAQIYLQSILL